MDVSDDTVSLIREAREGSREAFDALVQRSTGAIEFLIRLEAGARIQGQVEMTDLVQETFSSAFQAIRQLRGSERETFSRWLAQIARNVVRKHGRRRSPESPHEISLHGNEAGVGTDSSNLAAALDVGSATPSENVRQRERFERLRQALDRLSPDHRKVILLARVRELPIRDVARLMNRTPEAASMLLLRALQVLKSAFGTTESLELPKDMTLDEPDGGSRS